MKNSSNLYANIRKKKIFKRILVVAMATALLRIFWNAHYTVFSQININSDQIFVQFPPFMINLNSTWGCQLVSGCHTSIWHCGLLAHTCIFQITFQSLNVTLPELEALGTLMLVLIIITQCCSQFHLVPQHVDYQWHQQHCHHP